MFYRTSGKVPEPKPINKAIRIDQHKDEEDCKNSFPTHQAVHRYDHKESKIQPKNLFSKSLEDDLFELDQQNKDTSAVIDYHVKKVNQLLSRQSLQMQHQQTEINRLSELAQKANGMLFGRSRVRESQKQIQNQKENLKKQNVQLQKLIELMKYRIFLLENPSQTPDSRYSPADLRTHSIEAKLRGLKIRSLDKKRNNQNPEARESFAKIK